MIKYRSSITTQGSHMAGARALWRATGMKTKDFDKPIIAIVNSFSQFVPGHIHLRRAGTLVSKEIEKFGGVAKEFNTIAIDDGIAMGHSGMLYSLPSRELIADSIEYMINAHCVDAMVCISNCDKITPGMLMASLRLNIPSIFVSGGPMEAGRIKASKKTVKIDLIDVIKMGARPELSLEKKQKVEEYACSTCGSCSGLFTANSMNCLMEALGLSLPGNGSILATHTDRKILFLDSGKRIVHLTKCYYKNNDFSVLPRSIANKKAFENAVLLDIAMGGSTNTVLHLLASAQEGKIDFTMSDIDRLSRNTPHLCQISPNTSLYHMEDLHRAGGVFRILGELNRIHLLNLDVCNVLQIPLPGLLQLYDISVSKNTGIRKMYRSGPAGKKTVKAFTQSFRWKLLDTNKKTGCIRSYKYAYSKTGGLAILYGNLAKNGCVVKTAGIKKKKLIFRGIAQVYESQESAALAILQNQIFPGTVIVIRYEGPKGGPGMQEMLYPTVFLKSLRLDQTCALITDGRFSGGTSGISVGHISPEAANQGLIGIVKNGDFITIDIVHRKIILEVSLDKIKIRQRNEFSRKHRSWTPLNRNRRVSHSLRMYARFATSGDKGATRNKRKLKNWY